MAKNKAGMIWLAIIIVLAVVLVFTSVSGGGEYDEFAQCVNDAGAKMYGAYWCPHCADQKAMFGKSWKKVNYIECAKSRTEQTEECTLAGIDSYPTWEFADGSRQGGAISLQQLSQLTGCSL